MKVLVVAGWVKLQLCTGASCCSPKSIQSFSSTSHHVQMSHIRTVQDGSAMYQLNLSDWMNKVSLTRDWRETMQRGDVQDGWSAVDWLTLKRHPTRFASSKINTQRKHDIYCRPFVRSQFADGESWFPARSLWSRPIAEPEKINPNVSLRDSRPSHHILMSTATCLNTGFMSRVLPSGGRGGGGVATPLQGSHPERITFNW